MKWISIAVSYLFSVPSLLVRAIDFLYDLTCVCFFNWLVVEGRAFIHIMAERYTEANKKMQKRTKI